MLAAVLAAGLKESFRARAAQVRAAALRAERLAAPMRLNRPTAKSVAPPRRAKPARPASSPTGGGRPHGLTPQAWHELTIKSYRSDFLLQFHSFFRRAQIPPQMADRLAQQYADHKWSASQLRTQGLTSEIEHFDQSYQSDLRASLGESGYAQYQKFVQTSALQSIPTDLASNLAIAGSPLTAQQGDALTDALIRHATDASGRIDPRNLDWDAAAKEVAATLTPVQMQTLQLLSESTRAQWEYDRLRAAR